MGQCCRGLSSSSPVEKSSRHIRNDLDHNSTTQCEVCPTRFETSQRNGCWGYFSVARRTAKPRYPSTYKFSSRHCASSSTNFDESVAPPARFERISPIVNEGETNSVTLSSTQTPDLIESVMAPEPPATYREALRVLPAVRAIRHKEISNRHVHPYAYRDTAQRRRHHAIHFGSTGENMYPATTQQQSIGAQIGAINTIIEERETLWMASPVAFGENVEHAVAVEHRQQFDNVAPDQSPLTAKTESILDEPEISPMVIEEAVDIAITATPGITGNGPSVDILDTLERIELIRERSSPERFIPDNMWDKIVDSMLRPFQPVGLPNQSFLSIGHCSYVSWMCST